MKLWKKITCKSHSTVALRYQFRPQPLRKNPSLIKIGICKIRQKNDPGCKKVRFLEDLGLTETSEVIGFYSGFEDKRDLKAFKKDMLTKNWKVKICGENNME